jgi:hypothetical protein
MDPATVISVASVIFRIVKEVGPDVIKTAEDVIPFAERIVKFATGDHFDQEELDALNELINKQSAEIQKPLDPPTA